MITIDKIHLERIGGIMKDAELNSYILHYLKKDKTHTAVMLTGEWGSGKSYYIENELVPFLKKAKAAAVVVSLYGLNDISMISKSIYMELRMSILAGKQSESLTTGKIIAKNLLKNITGFVGIQLELSEGDLDKLYKSVDLKDKLLIFEDVERSSINIINLLGYVNSLVERDGVKVLLVANENEILGKTEFDLSRILDGKKNNVVKRQLLEDVKQYLRIKEKTISDTIQFNGDFEQAINQIIKGFNNSILDKIFQRNQKLNKIVSEYVNDICRKNLRTFIFAIQKTVDIIDKINCDNYDDDFFECLMLGNICFSSRIKETEFPKWDGDDYLSAKLGSNQMPLMRFAYDYIRWQNFDESSVRKVFKAYRDFRFFERDAENKDPDVKILSNYYVQTEESVLFALENIEKKLNNPNQIGIHAYCNLAYNMISVGSLLGFDYKKSYELMIKNAKGIKINNDIDSDIYFAYNRDIEDKKIKKIYEDFLKQLSEVISFQTKQNIFSYSPQDIEDLYNNICKNTYLYTKNHRFLSKYNLDNIVDMLLKSTSKQLDDFRGILFAIYRHAVKGEFDENDIDAMKQLLKKVEEKITGENSWDKIQFMQIDYLMQNLKQFIKQLS
jgi:hypothetical protein